MKVGDRVTMPFQLAIPILPLATSYKQGATPLSCSDRIFVITEVLPAIEFERCELLRLEGVRGWFLSTFFQSLPAP